MGGAGVSGKFVAPGTWYPEADPVLCDLLGLCGEAFVPSCKAPTSSALRRLCRVHNRGEKHVFPEQTTGGIHPSRNRPPLPKCKAARAVVARTLATSRRDGGKEEGRRCHIQSNGLPCGKSHQEERMCSTRGRVQGDLRSRPATLVRSRGRMFGSKSRKSGPPTQGSWPTRAQRLA